MKDSSRSNPFECAGYFDPSGEIDNTRRNLPHWRQPGVSYFVTFRLADSLPQDKLNTLREERKFFLSGHPEPWSEETQRLWYQMFGQSLQDWLDAGYGSCVLKEAKAGGIVASALKHFDGDRYDLLAYVVMPNHVHVLLTPKGQHTLDQILHSWKSFTASAINKALGRTGQLWQHETYDHIVRSPEALWSIARYILDNPEKAGVQTQFVESRVC